MKCLICDREMLERENCGGDCIYCMADLGDPDATRYCITKARELPPDDEELCSALQKQVDNLTLAVKVAVVCMIAQERNKDKSWKHEFFTWEQLTEIRDTARPHVDVDIDSIEEFYQKVLYPDGPRLND